METIIKSASTKVMLSYDYSHFEASMSLENAEGVSKNDIDNARKDCQRLCDKAVRQYQIAKNMAQLRTDGEYKIQNFERQCQQIIQKPEGERTLNEMAMLKTYENEHWRAKFEYEYDYEDDEPNIE
jgi:hypothetical protein